MSTITISLSDEQWARLEELALEAGTTPERFVRASVEEWLTRPREDFASAATYVLRKSAELHRRLA